MPGLQRFGDAPDASHVRASRSTPPGRTACRWRRRSPRPRSRSASPARPGRRSPRRSRPSWRRHRPAPWARSSWGPARPDACRRRRRVPRASTASLTWRSILSTARALIIGPICEPASLAGPTFSAPMRAAELVDEAVVNARLHEDPVRADAGLAAVAELGGHQPVDRGVEVGIVEDDEGRVAAEFERELLQRVGASAARGACPPASSR